MSPPPASVIADAVKHLLRQITSHEQLQLLISLRERAGTARSLAELGLPPGVSAELAHEAAASLARSGLAVLSEGTLIYGPSSPELGAAVDALVATYDDAPLEILKLMNDNAVRRIRTGAARALSDPGLSRTKKTD